MEALEPIIIHVIVLVTSCSIAGTKGTFYLFSHLFCLFVELAECSGKISKKCLFDLLIIFRSAL